MFSFVETLADGLHCYYELHSGMKPYFLCVTKWSHVLLCILVVCCDVHLGLGFNSMQDLGVEETPNRIDKPIAKRNLKKYKSDW